MDTVPDKSVRRFVRWLKDKVENRRGRDGDQDPWWVTLLLDVGRPLVAVLILTMCAPGEHFLAVQAGWNDRLAWGMPGTLTAYAGIAAVVATKRPRGAPGRKTAVTGAVVSVALAMAAQPVAHLYGRTGITRETIFLTVVMGLIPAAVFGHLLHMGAATPKPVRSVRTDKSKKPDKARTDRVRAGADSGVVSVRDWMADNGLSAPDKTRTRPDRPVPLSDRQNLSARALALAEAGQDKDTIKDTLRTEFPDAKPDSVRKAADRAVDKASAAS